jgi:excisionase family DNA binding protein
VSEAPEPRQTITIREAATLLGVHENTIRNWIDTDLIEAYRMPGRGKYRRPYADSVMEMVPDAGRSTALLRRLMIGKAEGLEKAAAALRRAVDMLEED